MSKIQIWFKNLKVSEKLALISIFFVMPDSVMLYLFITGINANLQFASLEKKGSEYQRPLEVLLELIPEHERLAEAALVDSAGGDVAIAEVAHLQMKIDSAFRELEAVDEKLGADLQFTDEGLAKRKREHFRPRLVRQDWLKLKTELPALDQAGLVEKHRDLVTGIRTMITHAGDLSNLILDPDLDSYYLMDATLLGLPQTQDRLATVTAYGTRILAGGQLTAHACQELAIHARLLSEADLLRIAGSVQTALNEDPNFYGVSPTLQTRVPPLLNEYVKSATLFIDLTTRLADGQAEELTAQEYLDAGRNARKASFELWRGADEEIDRLLDSRMEWYRKRRAKSLLVAALALGAAIGFVTFITKTISRPLKGQAEALRRANDSLQLEVLERKRAEMELRRSETQLATAQKVAGIGSWEWDLLTHEVTWSEENFRIHGFEPHSFQPSYQIALGLVHPEDRRDSDLHFQGAIRERKTFSFEQRILSNDGSERTLHQRGEVVLSHEGYAVRVIGTAQDVTERREAEQELRKANEELLTASRCAGMAEVATGVLHNVGNVLNSVNVSAMLLSDRLKRSKVGHLANASQLMKENATNLAEFFTCDPKGKMLPHFIHNVVVRVGVEHAELLKEVEGLTRNIGHIKDIVAVQQNYAKVSGVVETLPAETLIEDALQMNATGLGRHGVSITRDYGEAPAVRIDKHKALQILVNLIRNAKQALEQNAHGNKHIRLSVDYSLAARDRVRVGVSDNGIGIDTENLARVLADGFTTKHEGHGFGLHSAALAAAEMGGSLSASSEGPGLGATFTLELPVDFQNRN